MMYNHKSVWTGLLLSVGLLIIPSTAMSWDFFPTRSTSEGYYSPVFDPEARKVLFVQRNVTAWDWGPGWEFFSPPAWVRISRDRFQLIEFNLQTGTLTALRTFPKSPLAGKTHRHYRGRLYGSPRVMIRFERETGQLEYEIGLSLKQEPSSLPYRVFRRWNNASGQIEESQHWVQEHIRMQGLNEDRLRGEQELLTLPGRDGMPCAIVLWNHDDNAPHVLVQSNEFAEIYPQGIPAELLARDSRKERIEYLRSMRADYERFYRQHLEAGLRDNDARLAANKDMQLAGYYPKTPTISARLINDADNDPKLPIFEITRIEMESGIFNDIAAAIAAPGSDVDYNGHRYITYRGYDTSQQLNEHLQSGKLSYGVRYLGKTYLLTIDKP